MFVRSEQREIQRGWSQRTGLIQILVEEPSSSSTGAIRTHSLATAFFL
jgi:hypothetical protein